MCIRSSILYWAQIQIFGVEKKNHSSRAMARTKRRRKEEEESQRGGNKRRRPTDDMMTEAELKKRKRWDESWAEHVQLELAGHGGVVHDLVVGVGHHVPVVDLVQLQHNTRLAVTIPGDIRRIRIEV